MVVMACQFVYSGNYYVRANNGIFAIITSYQVGLTEAISFTPSSMHFNEDVLIQFVSDGSYESNFENNLTYQLFSLFWNNQDNLAIFTESGIDNQVENDFFENVRLVQPRRRRRRRVSEANELEPFVRCPCNSIVNFGQRTCNNSSCHLLRTLRNALLRKVEG